MECTKNVTYSGLCWVRPAERIDQLIRAEEPHADQDPRRHREGGVQPVDRVRR